MSAQMPSDHKLEEYERLTIQSREVLMKQLEEVKKEETALNKRMQVLKCQEKAILACLEEYDSVIQGPPVKKARFNPVQGGEIHSSGSV